MQNSNFRFSNPCLVNLYFDTNQNFHPSPDALIDLQLAFSVKIEKKKDANEAIVELTIFIGEEGSSSPFYIKAAESAKFSWNNSVNALADKLLAQNAPALLLGYLRPIISTLTASSPFNAYNIPFIDFTK